MSIDYGGWKKKSTDELIQELGTGQPGSPIEEMIRSLLYARSVQDLVSATRSLDQSIKDAGASSGRLQTAVVWLTAMIALATIAGVVVAVIAL